MTGNRTLGAVLIGIYGALFVAAVIGILVLN